MKKIAFQTLGCKLNQFETDSLASEFKKQGYTLVDFNEKADIYVINTCTVTNKADRKSRNIINRALKMHGAETGIQFSEVETKTIESPGFREQSNLQDKAGLVVVTGCYVNSHREALEADGRTFVVPNEEKRHLFSLVDAHSKGEIYHPQSSDLFEYSIADPIYHTRAMVKIQDGCDNFCTFCIIPFVRGTAQSRPKEAILQNINESLDAGYKEIVLTGVNMGRYSQTETDFTALVKAILEIPREFRLRISSLEPEGLGTDFIQLLKHPKMMPHLHLCLQSGSERVLLNMRRQYTAKEYMNFVHKVRKEIPDFNFTTDIIVGFPGETEEDHQESMQRSKDAGFGHIHTFPYSRRAGTRADRMPNQVSTHSKKERVEDILALSAELKQQYRESFVGRKQNLLVEKVVENKKEKGEFFELHGLGEHYLPIRVKIPALRPAEDYKNQLFLVKLTQLIQDDQDSWFVGELIDQEAES
jgi:threonylcarbamoyladenosine tRNA methylthiotransferase MtaB